MYNIEVATKDLLACFFEECERHFRFLEQDEGFAYLSGLVEYRNNYKIIKPYQNTVRAQQDFCAVTRYEHENISIEIVFSSEEFAVEGYIYFDRIDRLELCEMMMAAKKDASKIRGDRGLSHNDLVSEVIVDMATALKKNRKIFIKPKERLIEKALTIRNHRLEQAIREHFKNQLSEICKEAARAFTVRQYRKVVDLLQPLEPYLSNADRKKLNLARKNLQTEHI